MIGLDDIELEPGTYTWAIWELRYGRMPEPFALNQYEFAHVRSTINSFRIRMPKGEVDSYLDKWALKIHEPQEDNRN